MMREPIYVNDANFKSGIEIPRPCAGRLLGSLVRAVPDGRAGPGQDRC